MEFSEICWTISHWNERRKEHMFIIHTCSWNLLDYFIGTKGENHLFIIHMIHGQWNLLDYRNKTTGGDRTFHHSQTVEICWTISLEWKAKTTCVHHSQTEEMLDYIIKIKGEKIISSFTDNVKLINFIAWERKINRTYVHHSRTMAMTCLTIYRNETRGKQNIIMFILLKTN